MVKIIFFPIGNQQSIDSLKYLKYSLVCKTYQKKDEFVPFEMRYLKVCSAGKLSSVPCCCKVALLVLEPAAPQLSDTDDIL